MLVGTMDSAETIQITDEVMCLIDLQVEELKGSLLDITVSQVREYEETRDESANFVVSLEVIRLRLIPLPHDSLILQNL